MIFYPEKSKHIIKTGEIFKGLAVPDVAHYKREFMKPQYHLIGAADGAEIIGHAVYEVIGREMLFHLVNFRPVPGGVIGPLFDHVKQFGFTAINATAERRAMAKRLESLGFKHVFPGLYRAEVAHVL